MSIKLFPGMRGEPGTSTPPFLHDGPFPPSPQHYPVIWGSVAKFNWFKQRRRLRPEPAALQKVILLYWRCFYQWLVVSSTEFLSVVLQRKQSDIRYFQPLKVSQQIAIGDKTCWGAARPHYKRL